MQLRSGKEYCNHSGSNNKMQSAFKDIRLWRDTKATAAESAATLELRGMQCLKDTSGAKSSGSAANVLFNISISVSN